MARRRAEQVGVSALLALTAVMVCFLVSAGIHLACTKGSDFWYSPFCFLGAFLLSVRLYRRPPL